MKFYKEKRYSFFIWNKIKNNKLTCIYHDDICLFFYKNGKRHNSKNASYIEFNIRKVFRLYDKMYGYEDDFTKESWRRFVKLQAFL
jgi:hypothetical protein